MGEISKLSTAWAKEETPRAVLDLATASWILRRVWLHNRGIEWSRFLSAPCMWLKDQQMPRFAQLSRMEDRISCRVISWIDQANLNVWIGCIHQTAGHDWINRHVSHTDNHHDERAPPPSGSQDGRWLPCQPNENNFSPVRAALIIAWIKHEAPPWKVAMEHSGSITPQEHSTGIYQIIRSSQL